MTIWDGADITITGSVSNGTRIEVAPSANATITLDGVSITGMPGSSLRALRRYSRRLEMEGSPQINTGLQANESPLALNAGANVRLEIRGTNVLTAGDCPTYTGADNNCAGISAPGGYNGPYAAAVIGTTLSIDGTGTLTATGGDLGAGIGGSGYRSSTNGGGTITINSGAVTAIGGDGGAGIGGGGAPAGIEGSGGAITINGGTVTARGGLGSAGIGGGNVGPGGTITIKSGTVTADGGYEAAGIGGGSMKPGGHITITGDANVTATGGNGRTGGPPLDGGAGIGNGGGINFNSDAYRAAGITKKVADTTKIEINTTGTVNAKGGSGANGGNAGANISQGRLAGTRESARP